MRPTSITIDGPAASGKSTVGDLLARRLGYLFFDTGVMYRAVTWAAQDRRVSPEDESAVTALAEGLRIDVLPPTVDDGRRYTVLADGVDITWEIRSPDVNAHVSRVSTYPGVRRTLVIQQRRIAAQKPVVMVGRDIGTIVLPDAEIKVYLDATAEERARRRSRELVERGQAVDCDEILASIHHRDRIDSHRAISPLRAAEGAEIIDTTALTIDDVLETLVRLVEASACLRV